MKLLETEWDKFARAVVPKDASATQSQEMRRAFFAGAWALYSLIMNNMTPGPDSQPADEKLLEKLDAEMREFRDRVVKGWA